MTPILVLRFGVHATAAVGLAANEMEFFGAGSRKLGSHETPRWREMDSNHWSPFARSNHIRASTRRLSIIRSGMRFRPSSPAKSPSATKAEEPGSRDPRPGDRRNPRGDSELIGAPTAGTPSYAALAGSCLRL